MKEVKLTNSDRVALVDCDDFLFVNLHPWKLSANGYVVNERQGILTQLHRFIMQPESLDWEVDHKDSDRLNNQKTNLRICTSGQNSRNAVKRAIATSKFKGVSYMRGSGKWRARITLNYKTVDLGRYDTEIDAAKAYDNKAREIFGEFANLNFKDGE